MVLDVWAICRLRQRSVGSDAAGAATAAESPELPAQEVAEGAADAGTADDDRIFQVLEKKRKGVFSAWSILSLRSQLVSSYSDLEVDILKQVFLLRVCAQTAFMIVRHSFVVTCFLALSLSQAHSGMMMLLVGLATFTVQRFVYRRLELHPLVLILLGFTGHLASISVLLFIGISEYSMILFIALFALGSSGHTAAFPSLITEVVQQSVDDPASGGALCDKTLLLTLMACVDSLAKLLGPSYIGLVVLVQTAVRSWMGTGLGVGDVEDTEGATAGMVWVVSALAPVLATVVVLLLVAMSLVKSIQEAGNTAWGTGWDVVVGEEAGKKSLAGKSE